MIGTRVSGTLWHLHYELVRPDSAKPRVELTNAKPWEKKVGGECFVLTADPTGADLCDVAKMTVCGKDPCETFSLTHVHRVTDVNGLALVRKDPE